MEFRDGEWVKPVHRCAACYQMRTEGSEVRWRVVVQMPDMGDPHGRPTWGTRVVWVCAECQAKQRADDAYRSHRKYRDELNAIAKTQR